jgi:hypothetical protein
MLDFARDDKVEDEPTHVIDSMPPEIAFNQGKR